MFIVHYSNQLLKQKDKLIEILAESPNSNPFEADIVLVQSIGMAQWLQMQIADTLGIAGNIEFPYPTSFLWQQYRLLFPELPKENLFERSTIVWRLMRIIPDLLKNPEFSPLADYLQQSEQLKLFQLCSKIADLFDQYLVYRPHWLIHWENNQADKVLQEMKQSPSFRVNKSGEIWENILWQSQLWNKLVADIRQDSDEIIFNTSHRAYLQQRYFEKLDNLTEQEKQKLPKRIFIFGISSLPQTQLAVFNKLSEHCDICLFFTNPNESYWGDIREDRILAKLALKENIPSEELAKLFEIQGNPLLASWGKQGKEFLNLIIEQNPQEYEDYDYFEEDHPILLTQIKKAILNYEYSTPLNFDNSIQIHSCHSKMREVEVLHNQLLTLFETDPNLSPKDIIVMSADIDSYAPYINAVFSRYYKRNEKGKLDNRFIPFTLSDQKISQINPIIQSFLLLLGLKEYKFSAEEIFDLFDVEAIREKYPLSQDDLLTLRVWIKQAGIRAGLAIQNPEWQNYNSWQNGIERLLLGTSLTEESNAWQNTLAFNNSYGLNAELVGYLAQFLEKLTAWAAFIQQPQKLSDWKTRLLQLISDFYFENEKSIDTLLNLTEAIHLLFEQIEKTHFSDPIHIDIIRPLFEQQFNEQRNNLNFLVGKVNFCTLLPMRAIPFKVVCLLGMNEGEFPRQQVINSFDLMQYAQRNGDRARRDDDRYLFLEALLSAQKLLYISYIGQSLTGNSKKLPSILVSQLLDYINQNLTEGEFRITEQAMTVFSHKNFTNGQISYDQDWLDSTEKQGKLQPFLTPITQRELPNEIELNELIAYIQDPIRYFFNYHLGIRFDNNKEMIEESEIFNLSGLEKYHLLDELINVEVEELHTFFNNEKLKGNLPINYFGKIAETQLIHDIQLLKSELTPYLQCESQFIDIDFSLKTKEKMIKLQGTIPHCFENKLIHWRVGRLRDKDMIQFWIFYLVCKANQIDIRQYRFFYREKDQAKFFSFTEISSGQAMEILTLYLNDYLTSFSNLKWAITQDLLAYFDPKNTELSLEIHCPQRLNTLDNIYLQRILTSNTSLDFHDIHQRTLNWFSQMYASMQSSIK